MSTELDTPELQRLAALSSAVDDLRATLKQLERVRDSEIRQLRATGESAIDLGRIAGLTRGRVYQIIEGPPEDADGHDFSEFAERVDEAYEWAYGQWEAAGRAGEPDDFFPLERLLR